MKFDTEKMQAGLGLAISVVTLMTSIQKFKQAMPEGAIGVEGKELLAGAGKVLDQAASGIHLDVNIRLGYK